MLSDKDKNLATLEIWVNGNMDSGRTENETITKQRKPHHRLSLWDRPWPSGKHHTSVKIFISSTTRCLLKNVSRLRKRNHQSFSLRVLFELNTTMTDEFHTRRVSNHWKCVRALTSSRLFFLQVTDVLPQSPATWSIRYCEDVWPSVTQRSNPRNGNLRSESGLVLKLNHWYT